MFRWDKLIWATLISVMLGVVVAFVVMDARRPPLPVIGPVTPFTTLTNQLGAPVSLDTLRGRVWVADVIFSRCPGLCHQLSQIMARVQGQLQEGAPVRLVSLTADPEFDTPAVLARYGQRYGADPVRWWFFTGPKADVYRAATNSLKFTVLENSDPNVRLEDLFIHSPALVIVDQQGRIRDVVQAEQPQAHLRILDSVNRLLRER